MNKLITMFRKWYWRGHNFTGPCLLCPFPEHKHNHARNQQSRSGFY